MTSPMPRNAPCRILSQDDATDTGGSDLPEPDETPAGDAPGSMVAGPGRRPGAGLHFVATPIGAARDITLHALDILEGCDVLAAEDTRTLRRLMTIHGVPLRGRRILPYHDHNGARMRPRLLALAAGGRSVAYASDAGTPLVADPGFALARGAVAAGVRVHAAPGASAVLAALTVSGLPTDRFLFLGFLPPAKAARRAALGEVAGVRATLVIYETARRCLPVLREILSVMGNREAALCRELTKRFEEVRRGPLEDLIVGCEASAPRGEIVIVVDRGATAAAGRTEMEEALREAMERLSMKDAAREVAEALGLPRRDVYQTALELAGRS